jgi:hypothetical protein
MLRYPIVTLVRDDQVVDQTAVNVETLTDQLIPIRDVLLKLFQGASAKTRGELHRVEIGLALTAGGNIAFATGTTTPSLTLTLESRPRTPGTRSTTSRSSVAKKSDVVEID